MDFAQKLLDFDLAANNGGWQWCASTGVDASPYFRIFNPELQLKKFDPDQIFTKKFTSHLTKEIAPIVDYVEHRQLSKTFYTENLYRGHKRELS